ncbi:MAG: hypothetical protein ACT4QE_09485, partial [Anaerolineales bacterium]
MNDKAMVWQAAKCASECQRKTDKAVVGRLTVKWKGSDRMRSAGGVGTTMGERAMIKVLLADDHAVVRQGMKQILRD